jgi:hypothetical protein
MKINQLFKSSIPEELLVKILICYGFNSIDDEHSFCKYDIEKLYTVDKINSLKDEIAKHYLPCKSKIYLDNLDANKCITILRQILRLHGQILISRQKYIKQKKTTIYSIRKINDEEKNLNNIEIHNGETTIIEF